MVKRAAVSVVVLEYYILKLARCTSLHRTCVAALLQCDKIISKILGKLCVNYYGEIKCRKALEQKVLNQVTDKTSQFE